MKIIIAALLMTFTGAAFGDEVRCNGMVPLDKVSEFCGVEFVLNKARERKSSCTVSYLVADSEGISPELVFSTNNRVNSQGRVMASVSYSSSLGAAAENGRLREEINGLGEAAFYSEFDIHMQVTWYEGKNLNTLDVQKGKGYEQDWTPVCQKDQIIEIARLID